MTPNTSAPRASARDARCRPRVSSQASRPAITATQNRHTQQFRDEKTWFSVIPREHDQRQRACRDEQHPLPDESSESRSYVMDAPSRSI